MDGKSGGQPVDINWNMQGQSLTEITYKPVGGVQKADKTKTYYYNTVDPNQLPTLREVQGDQRLHVIEGTSREFQNSESRFQELYTLVTAARGLGADWAMDCSNKCLNAINESLQVHVSGRSGATTPAQGAEP